MFDEIYEHDWNESLPDNEQCWSEPIPDIPPPLESTSDSYSGPEPEPIRIPKISEIVNFQDTSILKTFLHDNKLDNTWYIVLAIKDKGAVRSDLRPNRGKLHPCYLFKME